ncbi:MAG: amino acid ABC transporter permease [Mesorhizobium sp.]
MAYEFQFAVLAPYIDDIVDGALLTIRLSAIATVLGLAIAILCALVRTAAPRAFHWPVIAYVELIRNTPFLVQIFFIFFGLPALGLRLSPNGAALLALTVNLGAYATEIIRAGILSIDRGQIEAGTALGLNRLQVFAYVVLRPALRTVFPALSSQFILLMLASSVVSAVSAHDLTSAANQIGSETFRSFEIYIVVTAVYLALALAFAAVFGAISRTLFSYPTSR